LFLVLETERGRSSSIRPHAGGGPSADAREHQTSEKALPFSTPERRHPMREHVLSGGQYSAVTTPACG
jgi:hypothetical protein